MIFLFNFSELNELFLTASLLAHRNKSDASVYSTCLKIGLR